MYEDVKQYKMNSDSQMPSTSNDVPNTKSQIFIKQENVNDDDSFCNHLRNPSELKVEYVNYYELEFDTIKHEISEYESAKTDYGLQNRQTFVHDEKYKVINKRQTFIKDKCFLNETVKSGTHKYQDLVIKTEKLDNEDILNDVDDCNSVHYDLLVTPEQVECKLCRKTFLNRLHFAKHNIQHLRLGIVRCNNKSAILGDKEFTKFEFNVNESLEKSVTFNTEHHLNDLRKKSNIKFKCKLCKNVFQSVQNLLSHVKRFHSHKEYEDELCEAIIRNKRNLMRNVEVVNFNEKYRCELCKELCKNERYLSRHMKRVHSKNQFKCELCEVIFSRKQILSQHIKRLHSRQNCRCVLCESIFISKQYLLKHIKEVHTDQNYECQLCKANFNRKQYLTQHMKIVHSNGEYKCSLCKVISKSKHYLSQHMKRVHSNKQYKCELCEVVLKDKQNFTKHMKVIHSNEEYKCELCGVIFKSKQYLSKHKKKVHSNEEYNVK